MWVEDIESAVKEHIAAAYSNSKTGELDDLALQTAINDVTDYSDQIAKKIHKGLSHYFRVNSIDQKPDEQLIEVAFAELIDRNKKPRQFDDLTLYEYTEILLHKGRRDYRSQFGLSDTALRNLLDEIRITRNTLAHFRSDISNRQRKQLRDCAELFDRYSPTVAQITKIAEFSDVQSESGRQPTVLSPVEEQIDSETSRDARLAAYLRNIPTGEEKASV